MKDKPILEWDECNLIDAEVEYRLESEDYEGDEEDLRNELYQDSNFFEMRWDEMTEHLSYIMEGLTKRNIYKDKWTASVENFGWRNQDGSKTFTAENGQELLNEILPKTDCTFRVFKNGRNSIKIQNFHHDSPTGREWYYIRPMTLKEVQDED